MVGVKNWQSLSYSHTEVHVHVYSLADGPSNSNWSEFMKYTNIYHMKTSIAWCKSSGRVAFHELKELAAIQILTC